MSNLNHTFIFLIFLCTSCFFNDDYTAYCERDFLFEFDARLENPSEYYALGDTLRLSMSIDSLTEDRLTGKNINLFEKDEVWRRLEGGGSQRLQAY